MGAQFVCEKVAVACSRHCMSRWLVRGSALRDIARPALLTPGIARPVWLVPNIAPMEHVDQTQSIVAAYVYVVCSLIQLVYRQIS